MRKKTEKTTKKKDAAEKELSNIIASLLNVVNVKDELDKEVNTMIKKILEIAKKNPKKFIFIMEGCDGLGQIMREEGDGVNSMALTMVVCSFLFKLEEEEIIKITI